MELKQLVEFAILHNLRHARYKDLEVEFFEPVRPETKQETIAVEHNSPSEDELLFYSTDHYDHLRDERDNAKD